MAEKQLTRHSRSKSKSKEPGVPKDKGQALQARLYFILEKLQGMAKEVPTQHQQRISAELLSGLANCLLHSTVFEIVKGLQDIQIELQRQMFHNRVRLLERLRNDRKRMTAKYRKRPILLDTKLKKLNGMQWKIQRCFDIKIIRHLENKVIEQQQMMEKAGVPGFYVTSNPQEIRVQMLLLEFILKLGAMKDIPKVDFEDEKITSNTKI